MVCRHQSLMKCLPKCPAWPMGWLPRLGAGLRWGARRCWGARWCWGARRCWGAQQVLGVGVPTVPGCWVGGGVPAVPGCLVGSGVPQCQGAQQVLGCSAGVGVPIGGRARWAEAPRAAPPGWLRGGARPPLVGAEMFRNQAFNENKRN